MNKNTKSNKILWEEMTKLHLSDNKIYPIDKFKLGKSVLHNIEIDEVGDVKNKKLLHLQCHFGMDTLSWARMGATVTGVDFSEKAVLAATQLANEIGIKANFYQSDILELKGKIKNKFDIVFASYGALYWIQDLSKWMDVAASYLKRNGILYVIDGHPFYNWLNRDENKTDIMNFPYSYFDRSIQKSINDIDYTGKKHKKSMTECGWHYTASDLINAAIKNGFCIESFNEFPYSSLKAYKSAWRHIGLKDNVPILFSMKAKKV